ncbi:MAG: hypothetical protein QW112_02170, partial [Candidatus Micrarchaeia archaeon]
KFSVARFGKVLSENPMKGEQNSANPRLPFQQRLQTCQTPLRQERQSWQIGSNDNVRLAYSTGDSIQTDIPTGLEDMRDINNILSPEQKILLSENAQARETLKNFIREIERPNIHNKIREK